MLYLFCDYHRWQDLHLLLVWLRKGLIFHIIHSLFFLPILWSFEGLLSFSWPLQPRHLILIIDLTAEVTTRFGLFHLLACNLCNFCFLLALLAFDRYPTAFQRYLHLGVPSWVELIAFGHFRTLGERIVVGECLEMEGIFLLASIVLQHPYLHFSLNQVLAQCVDWRLHDIVDYNRRLLLSWLMRIGMRVQLLAETHTHGYHVSSIVPLVLQQVDQTHHDFFVEWLRGLLEIGGSALLVG